MQLKFPGIELTDTTIGRIGGRAMSEPIDVYSDQFQLGIGAFGATMNFGVSSPKPAAPGSPPQAESLASVRTSIEHLKVMAFTIRRSVMEYEQKSGLKVGLPVQALNALHISPEDWEGFWKEL